MSDNNINNNNNLLFSNSNFENSHQKIMAASASMKSEPLKSTFSIRSILEQQEPEPETSLNLSETENDLIENEEILDNEIDEPELPIEEAVKKETDEEKELTFEE